MALERRRLLLPLGLILLFSFLLFSFRSSSSNHSNLNRNGNSKDELWENEGLIPYEQELELEVKGNKQQQQQQQQQKQQKHDDDDAVVVVKQPVHKEYNPQDISHEEVDIITNNNEINRENREIASHTITESTNQNAIVLKLTTNTWPVPKNPNGNGRYLSYIAHSGFHNQRISLVNALLLAQMLDRTLLVPPATLGRAVDWVKSPLLQTHVEQAEKSNLAECKSMVDKDARREKCGIYWNSRRASWSWLINAKALYSQQPLIDRPTHDKTWYFEELGIKNSDIKSFEDPSRHSYRFFESSSMQDGNPDPGEGYTSRLNIDQLKTTTDGYMLLEFGSLYGSNRIVLENLERKTELEKLMSFNQPVLEKASEAVANSLGGRGNFVGLHLRVGHGDKFEIEARDRTGGVFKRLLIDAYGLDDKTANSLLAKNREDPTRPTFIPSSLEIPGSNSKTYYPSPNLACSSLVYSKDSPLVALNTPLYIATDSPSPSKDPLINVFRNTFPCIFYLEDFKTLSSKNQILLEPLDDLQNYVDETAEPLEKFLIPFVDAEIAAKGKIVIGTPGSTFSTYLKTTLFDAYRGTSGGKGGGKKSGAFGTDNEEEEKTTSGKVQVVTIPAKGKGKDRESMLAAEKELVKKPSKLDQVPSSTTSKSDGSKTSEKVLTSEKEEEEILPDQMKEEIQDETREGKILTEDEVKQKFKADKLAAEKKVPLTSEGPSDLSTSAQEELLNAQEQKFSDKVESEPQIIKSEKEQIKDVSLELKKEAKKEGEKYIDEPVEEVEKIKGKSRLKPEVIVDEDEYTESY